MIEIYIMLGILLIACFIIGLYIYGIKNEMSFFKYNFLEISDILEEQEHAINKKSVKK